MSAHTYAQCAESYTLWEEFVDPDGVDSKEFFESLSVEKKIAMQVEMFGPEEEAE